MQTKFVLVAIVAASSLSAILTYLLMPRNSALTPEDPAIAQAITQRVQKVETELAAVRAQLDTVRHSRAPVERANRDTSFLLEEQDTVVSDATLLLDDDDPDPQPSDLVEVDSTPLQTLQDIRRQRLVSGGFTNDEANWVLQAESDVTLERLYDQYQARRDTVANSDNQARASQANRLRAKLGDDYYERYLEANGWPTRVSVGSVIRNSPGFDAGLRAGDQVISYNGQRVFNVQDINNLSILGTPGESVLVEVERDGNPVQITLPRGPIGIVAGRSRNRR